LLNSFRNRLFKAKNSTFGDENEQEDTESKKEPIEEEEESGGDSDFFKSLLTHKLEVDDEIKQKVIDANVADHERYDIYDPRNPLNKRKREESKAAIREKKSSYGSSSQKFSI
jgi:peptidyl-prolyl cis-trans isomerase SDCCAG10